MTRSAQARHRAHVELAGAQVRERLVRHVGLGERLEDVARPGAPQGEAGVTRGDVLDPDGVAVGDVGADPRLVVVAEGGAGHQPEALLVQARHREVALHAAAGVEELGVGDRAGVAGHAVGTQPLEELRRAGAAHVELGERGLVEQRGVLPARPVLGADGGRPQLARPPVGPQRLVAGRRRWTRTS